VGERWNFAKNSGAIIIGGESIMACFQNLMMEENGSFQVRAEGSTRGRVELRPRAGAVPKPFENTP
jgi:hypothetical protein